MSESRLAQLLSPTYRGGYGFGEKAARNLEILLGIELLYFDLFAASASSGANAYKRVAQSSAVGCDYIEIRNVALTLTAGDPDFTIQADDSDGRLIGFRCEWFKARGFQPEKLIATIARDKSMAPTIIAGDAVVINTCDTRLSDGAIYAFNYEGGQIIKTCSQRSRQMVSGFRQHQSKTLSATGMQRSGLHRDRPGSDAATGKDVNADVTAPVSCSVTRSFP